MTMHDIASVEARRPAPFTFNPILTMVLASQVGTGAHYMQLRHEDESMEMVEAEARAMETTGTITADALAADWALITGESEFDAEMADENALDAAALAEGPEVQVEDPEEEVEPLV